MTHGRPDRCFVYMLITVLLAGAVGDVRADPADGLLDVPVVFTQLPPRAELERRGGRCDGVLRGDYGQGGRIVRLDPDGTLTVLTEEFDSACGADVSFDGQRILFSGKRLARDPWNVWEMEADGTSPTGGAGARQITRDCGNCRSPAYQATLYTIVSTEPWYQIMFVSDAAGAVNEYGCGPATSLYSCRLDGNGVRRLTFNLSDDLDPFLMPDGRVLLACWQRMDLRRGLLGRVTLFGVNTDGTDYALYCGERGRRIKHMPCRTTSPNGGSLDGGLVVFVEADQMGWDGAGQLASVSARRPMHSYRQITDERQWLYHSPSPLPHGALLVSRRPAGKPIRQVNDTHGLYRLDPGTGDARLIFDDPGFHDVHARALVPRSQPDGRSSVVNEDVPTGRLYGLNAYLTDPPRQTELPPGTIRRIRVIGGVTANGSPPAVRKRLLGSIAVERDGSFQIEIPADLPVQLQTLDEEGMALRTCGWIWAKHREWRGCIGCHEDPELTPENRFVLAVQKPGIELTPPAQDRRTVDFRRNIMPIVRARCAGCHDNDVTPPNLGDEPSGSFNQAYVSLVALGDPLGARSSAQGIAARAVVGRYVVPGKARASPLIWRLYGRNTSRPWDAAYSPNQAVAVHPPSEADRLSDDEKRAFVEWIDLGAAWDGGSEN